MFGVNACDRRGHNIGELIGGEVGDVPAGVMTVTSDGAGGAAGLVAVIVVSLTTVTPVAGVAPKSTSVAPVKSVPVIVTKMPPPRRNRCSGSGP